jgi:hypothetical protein
MPYFAHFWPRKFAIRPIFAAPNDEKQFARTSDYPTTYNNNLNLPQSQE